MGDSFGTVLTRALESSGYTQISFSQAVRINQGQLSRILNATRRPPLAAIPRWLDLLGVNGADRERLLLLANLAHSPPWMEVFVDRLLAHLATTYALQEPLLFRRLAENPTPNPPEDPNAPQRRTRRPS